MAEGGGVGGGGVSRRDRLGGAGGQRWPLSRRCQKQVREEEEEEEEEEGQRGGDYGISGREGWNYTAKLEEIEL